jgi:hypothetical protein
MSADNWIAVWESPLGAGYFVSMEMGDIPESGLVSGSGSRWFENYQDAVDYAYSWEAREYVEYGVQILCENPDNRTGRDNESRSEISRHHKDFESISAVCTLVRNGRMTSDEALQIIQNIVEKGTS